jgi:hypothetical protein
MFAATLAVTALACYSLINLLVRSIVGAGWSAWPCLWGGGGGWFAQVADICIYSFGLVAVASVARWLKEVREFGT